MGASIGPSPFRLSAVSSAAGDHSRLWRRRNGARIHLLHRPSSGEPKGLEALCWNMSG